jgi:hypothetical protein
MRAFRCGYQQGRQLNASGDVADVKTVPRGVTWTSESWADHLEPISLQKSSAACMVHNIELKHQSTAFAGHLDSKKTATICEGMTSCSDVG